MDCAVVVPSKRIYLDSHNEQTIASLAIKGPLFHTGCCSRGSMDPVPRPPLSARIRARPPPPLRPGTAKVGVFRWRRRVLRRREDPICFSWDSLRPRTRRPRRGRYQIRSRRILAGADCIHHPRILLSQQHLPANVPSAALRGAWSGGDADRAQHDPRHLGCRTGLATPDAGAQGGSGDQGRRARRDGQRCRGQKYRHISKKRRARRGRP